MFINLGAILVTAGALALNPKSYIYCRLGGGGGLAAQPISGLGTACPLMVDRVESFFDHVSGSLSGAGDRFTGIVGDAFAGMGNMVSDSIHGGVGEAFTGVFGGIGDMASDAAWFMYDTSRRFIPVTTDTDPVPLLPDAFVDDPGDPYAALLTGFQEDVRKWSTTTDIIVPPIFDLADWTTDLIVRPPGDIIVWVPHTLRTCLWAERPRRNPAPSEIEDSSSVSTSGTPYAVNIARSVVEGFQDRHHAGSRRTAHALVLFYTMVIAYVAVATLEPVRTAWRTSLVGHLGLPAMFGFVMRSLYSSMLFMASLKGMPADDHVQRMAGLTRKTIRQLRRASSQDHALIGGPRPLIAYDLANYTPAPRLALRPLLVVFWDGPVPTPVAIPRSATRSRTFSAMTFMEARRAAPKSSGPLNMVSLIEEDVPATTMGYAKRLLRRQQPGLQLLGLSKRRLHRPAVKPVPTEADVDPIEAPIQETVREPCKAATQDHALMGGPRPMIAYDLANFTPMPRLALPPLLLILPDGPLALVRSATRPRTFSAMTGMEARPGPSSGPLTMASIIEEDVPETTMRYAKRLLRRQQPGLQMFGLWKRRVHRHAELRALRDKMGEDAALRHAQEGRKILQQNLRAMWAEGGRLERPSAEPEN
ncbi:uncharacterized protein B0H18DRAFT_1118756 [Fomitopsis serialis]|uniref:uncharacterized protein n=1 Tax=Fomitopsis serialis TaxID=139415 RepID=UPI002007606F|nr:uncharacterized protein B0H18DRAFT_1118756 [Neoantrodia serialis]KAH9926676.1 hypothetical protein B0H18DRAFT_1118756 [Neoantrodia serialis]